MKERLRRDREVRYVEINAVKNQSSLSEKFFRK